jgi:microsomal dipeptidase-like Zn-dependent dipeptidase
MAQLGGPLRRRRSGRRAALPIALAASAVLLIGVGPQTAGAQAQTRYSIAGGCFTLGSAGTGQPAPGGGTLRFQATELGSYLLYRQAGDFLAAGAGGSVGPAAQPSPAADWTVEDASGAFTLSPKSAPAQVLAVSGGQLRLVPRAGAGEAARFSVSPAAGCAAFPEAELNVSGTPSRGETSYGEVTGLLDGHMHWMTFEYLGGNFHCGRPWHRYGIPAALPDCSSIEGPAGAAAPMQNFLNYGNPVQPHDTSGWPKLTAWSRTNVTYEGIYHRWMERVWRSGLRLIVMPVNENRVLCQLQANRRTSCDEMTTVRQGIRDIEELQDYVDAQAGGPGQGFFEVVRDPFQARRVVNQGKLAVVLEVEISELFGCRGFDNPTCTKAQIDAQLQDLYDRGVRSSLLLNKWDNSLSGVRFDSGEIGLLINAGNRESSGSFWSARTCPGPERDNTIFTGVPQASSFLASLMTALGAPPGTAPAYPPAPHCNTRGLSELGAHTVREMMRRGMIVNPDHMSQLGVDATLRLAEERRYSGVISPHSWMDPRNWPRIWALGGMAFPSAGSASGFVEDWRNQRPAETPFYFGWGWGADLGGLATQGAPVPADSPARVTYPFKSLDGAVTVDRQRSGQRTFDYSNEGVAHYGLYAEWAEEVRKLGGPQIVNDLLRGPEAYLQMWERAVGVPASRCVGRRARFTRGGLGAIRLGMGHRTLLESAGQPLRRTRTWSYCVDGNGRAGTSAVMTPEGRVALIASTGPGHRARGVRPGTRLAKLRRGKVKRIGGGVWIGRLGKTRVAYLVRGKRVRTVAIAGPEARSRKTLREHLAMVTRVATKARSSFVTAPGTAPVTPQNAAPLVQKHDPEKYALFCDLGL